MGKKSTPAPPPAPDPREIARTDAEFNRINQITPYGSLTYSGPNRNTATLELPPEIQALFDQQLQSDSAMLGQALQRQGDLPTDQIDLSRFGDIQAGIDTSNINFEGFNPTNLPNVSPVDLQRFTGNVPEFTSTDLQTGVDTSGLPEIPTDIQGYRGDVEQAFFDRQRALLDPVLADQQRQLTNTLANRGLPESGEAFDRDTTRFLDARNRAFTDLSRNAVLAGGSEASRQLGDTLAARGQGFGQELARGQFGNSALGQQFGQQLAAGQQNFANQLGVDQYNNQVGLMGLGADQALRQQMFGEQVAGSELNNQASAQNLALQTQLLNFNNQARAQSLAEQQGIRNNQFNELAALLGLQQVQGSQLSDFYQPAAAPVLGAYGLNQQAQQNAYNAQVQNQGNALSGLFGLGGAILGGPMGGAIGSGIGGLFGGGGGGGGGSGGYSGFPVSDVRLKENIEKIGEHNGINVYKWDWKTDIDQPTVGVLAQEIQLTQPDIVHTNENGYLTVDYGKLKWQVN